MWGMQGKCKPLIGRVETQTGIHRPLEYPGPMANDDQAMLRPSQVNVRPNCQPMSSAPCVSRTPTIKAVNLLLGHVVSTKMAGFLSAEDAGNAKIQTRNLRPVGTTTSV